MVRSDFSQVREGRGGAPPRLMWPLVIRAAGLSPLARLSLTLDGVSIDVPVRKIGLHRVQRVEVSHDPECGAVRF